MFRKSRPVQCVGGPDNGRFRPAPDHNHDLRPSSPRSSGTYRLRRIDHESVLVYEPAECPHCGVVLITLVDAARSADGRLNLDYRCASCGYDWRERF